VNVPSVPEEVVALADERAAARVRRDYRTADELKARIEAAGWKVIDFGAGYDLEPARPADVTDGEHTLYGAVDSVPSRLNEPATAPASVVVITEDASPDAVLDGLASTAPTDTQVVVLAGPGISVIGPADEVIATAVPFGAGDALQAALRRATGEIIVVLEARRVPKDDIVTPLRRALDDPSVAIVGASGLHSADLHRYHPATGADATTVASGAYALRRAELIERGPVDGRLKLRGSVAAWLGLLLRDEGPDARPRRAVVVDLPLGDADAEPELPEDHARVARRDGYRVADRFRGHDWLTGEQLEDEGVVGDGPDDRQRDDHTEEAGQAGEP
jgi:hypothetical protein